jgi:hypothetical protein
MNRYVIRCITDHSLLWSNTDGWVDDDCFDVFTLEETESLNLPLEGEWALLQTI